LHSFYVYLSIHLETIMTIKKMKKKERINING